ncbi:hypothetical protein [uncultured Brevundimonas sp.]|uniref:hypothetical protein n=1 Tax=uncultured Brevundimonas sp. TaxID=213418 RepID=UPI0025FA6851|nr:hypothetical protein [uncultured Brevundimonas sp.]
MDKQASKDGFNPKGLAILLLILLAVAGLVFTVWTSGKTQAEQEDAFSYPCQLASETPIEAEACIESMKARYRGSLDDPGMVANAAAEHVRRYRAGE